MTSNTSEPCVTCKTISQYVFSCFGIYTIIRYFEMRPYPTRKDHIFAIFKPIFCFGMAYIQYIGKKNAIEYHSNQLRIRRQLEKELYGETSEVLK